MMKRINLTIAQKHKENMNKLTNVNFSEMFQALIERVTYNERVIDNMIQQHEIAIDLLKQIKKYEHFQIQSIDIDKYNLSDEQKNALDIVAANVSIKPKEWEIHRLDYIQRYNNNIDIPMDEFKKIVMKIGEHHWKYK